MDEGMQNKGREERRSLAAASSRLATAPSATVSRGFGEEELAQCPKLSLRVAGDPDAPGQRSQLASHVDAAVKCRRGRACERKLLLLLLSLPSALEQQY